MKALMTGATGLIGRRLLAQVDAVRVLARNAGHARRDLAGITGAEVLEWGSSRALPAGALEGVEVVFHLAGSPVAAGRMNAARKQEIRDSRVLGTRRVVDAIKEVPTNEGRPRVLVCASAVGIYGSRGDELLDEASARGDGFLADVCAEWEAEASVARTVGVRVVCARIGIVLARESGALAAMRPAFLAGIGGPLGDGTQWTPWVHIDDVVSLLLHAATVDAIDGPMNVCAPSPVTNAAFTKSLARALHRPAFLRAPAAVLRLLVGDLADVVVASQRVLPSRALASGYSFRFAELEHALSDLLDARPPDAHAGRPVARVTS